MRDNSPIQSVPIAIAAILFTSNISNAATTVLDDLVVHAGELREESIKGSYGQPEWTQHRRFSNTRVYIQKDPGEMGVETWYRVRDYDDGRVTQRFQQEFEIGLPGRMQLDLYEKLIHDNSGGHWVQDEFAVELRYAFADWNVIWGNPTLYLEYAFKDEGPDVLETKLLFGGGSEGWHWGANLINAHEVWGEEKDEWAVATGLSKTIIDSKLSLGLEGQWTHPEGDPSEFILGPSLQWLPSDHTHLDLVVMGGLNDASPNMEAFLIFGFDFGSGSSGEGYKPVSIGGF